MSNTGDIAIRPLHVGKFFPPPYAGIEAHIDSLLRALAPEAHPTLLAAQPTGATVLKNTVCPYRCVSTPSYFQWSSVQFSPAVPWLARRELVSGRANLLHVHTPNPWGDMSVLCAPRGVPMVMTWHSDIVRQRQLYQAYRPIQRRAMSRVDRIVVFTPKHYEGSTQLHQADFASRIVRVPTGIDFERLQMGMSDLTVTRQVQAFSAGRPVILSVGRHVYYKGYDYLLRAFAQLRSDAVLVLVGKGPLSDGLKTLACELGIRDHVLFLGELSPAGLVAALHACDIFCLPSIEAAETFGIATAEAMACAKPTVVCQLHNGVNYLNREGETSLVVPPRDVPALASALDILVLDEAARARMGVAANAWVRSEFSMDAMKQATLTLYRSLM